MKKLTIFSCVILMFLQESYAKDIIDEEKMEFCSRLRCDKNDTNSVCGLRAEQDGFRLKLFKNECELLMHGCSVDEEYGESSSNASNSAETPSEFICTVHGYGVCGLTDFYTYGLINDEYCRTSPASDDGDFNETVENYGRKLHNIVFNKFDAVNECIDKCINNDTKELCGITEDGGGFRIKLFKNRCDLIIHNCKNTKQFIETDFFICKEINSSSYKEHRNNTSNTTHLINYKEYNNNIKFNDDYVNTNSTVKNLVVINRGLLGPYENINDSIDTFFAASHVFDLPIKQVPFNTRRKWLKYAGPINVFVPWIVKPKNISNDTFHRPTLSSCYHKCPFKCPDTYAPVCGTPGVLAREPSIMFQNHCFMDVAQCKMFWENKSSTSHSSSYVESSFLFCMGDEMNAVYRFLPAIRTLQHMGRLKKKGKFRAILKNFKHLSEFRSGRPKFMG